MSNPYYGHTTYPTYGSQSSSILEGAEFAKLETAFGKLPSFVGYGTYLTKVNTGETALVSSSVSVTDAGIMTVPAGLVVTSGTVNLTGTTPSVPTAAAGTNTTQAASCAFVLAQAMNAALPAQVGNAGKYVTTDGTTASWTSAWSGSVVTGQYGGSGVANTGTTFTRAGNVTFAGAFGVTVRSTATTDCTLPAGTDTAAGLGTAQTFTKAQTSSFYTLTDAATIALDLSQRNQFQIQLGGNRTLGVPTGAVAGQLFSINAYQDTTGTRTLAYSWPYSWFGGTAGVLSTPGGTHDILSGQVDAWNSGTMTTTIATPGVGTFTAHGFFSGQKCQITTTGALPTGLTASTTYYLHVIDANTFHFCTSLVNVAAGTYIATSGTQSGVHTLTGGKVTLVLNKASA